MIAVTASPVRVDTTSLSNVSQRQAGERLTLDMTDRLHPFDQTGVDQQPVEAPRLGAAGTGVEGAVATFENPFLLGIGGIEREAGSLLHDEGQIRRLERVERGRDVLRPVVDG